MGIIQDVRAKHPEYNDMSDADLADKLYTKFYSDMPKAEFDKRVGVQPQGPQLSELDKSMDARVAKEAEAGLAPRPSPVQYTPIGSWVDEGAALLDTGLGKITGGRLGAQSYEEAKAYQNARQRYIDANASGLQKGAAMVGGVLASPAGPAVNIAKGTTLLPTMANAAATGVAYGGLYGAGEGDSAGDRAVNAGTGALIGLGTGLAVAPIARGVGNAIEYARNRSVPVPNALANLERGAVNRVADDMRTDGVTPWAYTRQTNELGDFGMLADMGENLMASTETLAQTHGPQLPIVRQALRARQQGAPTRISNALDANLGQAGNLADDVQRARQAFNQQARPHYEQFHATSIPVTPELAETMGRIPTSAFREAQEMARREGVRQQFRLRPFDEPMTRMTGVRGMRPEQVPTGLEYDYLKRAVDDMAGAAQRANPGGNEARVLSGLARDLRNGVDNVLSPGAPDQSPWAIARSISGEGLEGREAAKLGSNVFSSKRDPYIVADELAGLSQHGRAMYQQGARNDLRVQMGRAATNFGPRGDAAARRSLNSDFANENIRQIAGPRAQQEISRRIQAENRMAETFNQAMMNSATARRLTGREKLPWGAGREVSADAPRSFGEAAFAIAKRGMNALMNGALGERAGRIMADQAKLLVARGIQRDQYAAALMQLAQTRGLSAQQRQTVDMMLRAVGGNVRAPAIDAVTSQ